MSFNFLVSFGYDYEGEVMKESRLFSDISELDSILESVRAEKSSFDYYEVAEILSNGKLRVFNYERFYK